MEKSLKGHYIICGAGRTGQVIATFLEAAGKKFVFIDRDGGSIEASGKKYTVIKGDITDEEALRKGGIEGAAGLFSVVNSDADNLVAVLVSHELRPTMPIYARASGKRDITRMKRAGATLVLSPAIVCGEELANKMLGSKAPQVP